MRTRNNEYNVIKTVNIVRPKLKLDIKISLDDECSNGHCDFSITANGYEKNPNNGRWYDSFGGCCHDEILKYRPDLKIFVDLHLSQSDGKPMYWLGNGAFRIEQMLGIDQFDPEEKDYKKMVLNHFRISEEQLNEMLEPFTALYNVEELKEVKASIKPLQDKYWDNQHAAGSLKKVNQEDYEKYRVLAEELDNKAKKVKSYLEGVRNELQAFVSDYCTKNLFAQWKKEADEAIELLNSL